MDHGSAPHSIGNSSRPSRVAIDITVTDRVKTGSAVYVQELLRAMDQLQPADLEMYQFKKLVIIFITFTS